MTQQLASNAQPETTEKKLSEFDKLIMQDFKPDAERKERIDRAVQTLAQQALNRAKVIDDDVHATIDALRLALDKKLSDQINLILHHPKFQALESAWRGLEKLVYGTSTGADLKIKVLNVRKEECLEMFRANKDAKWDQSPLFRKLYEQEYGQLGGQPYGAIVCDYTFTHSKLDVEVMEGLAKIGAAAHAPFIAAAGPGLLGMDSWQGLGGIRDLGKLFTAGDYKIWNSFRDSPDSRYMALTMPRVLGRAPYGAKTDPVEEFDFEEITGGDDKNYLWTNSAYAMGLRITEAFTDWGWTTQIRGVVSGGTVGGLPVATFSTDDGGVDEKCPTEIAIPERREFELSNAGLISLVHRKNTNTATFIGAQTVNKPREYDTDEANASANLSARLPYIFATCRFAHYLKCMIRDWVGSYKDAPTLSYELNRWISKYVDAQSESSSEETKAKLPLRAASIEIIPDESNPGSYKAKFHFVPHYQLEVVDAQLSMVSRLPDSVK